MKFIEQIKRLRDNIKSLWANPELYGCETPEQLMSASNSLTREVIKLEKAQETDNATTNTK